MGPPFIELLLGFWKQISQQRTEKVEEKPIDAQSWPLGRPPQSAVFIRK
jgi:hypothetical protein